MDDNINLKYIKDCGLEDDMMRNTVISCLLMILSVVMMPASIAQRSVQQYLHFTGLPYSTSQLPATPYTTASTNMVTSSSPVSSQAIPATGLPSLAALSLPSLIVAASQPQTEPCENTIAKDLNIEGKLLNNLAIALQMLILKNILNSTPTDKASDVCKPKISESLQSQSTPQNNFSPTPTTYSQTQIGYSPPQTSYSPPQTSYSPPQTSYSPPQTTYSSQPSYSPSQYSYTQPQNSYSSTQSTYSQDPNSYSPTLTNYSPPQYYVSQTEQVLPSANLVSVSNFGEQTVKRTRNNFDLMSPYEALAKSYSDSSSTYMPSTSRRDFQSPYAMIDTNMDFFPINDLF